MSKFQQEWKYFIEDLALLFGAIISIVAIWIMMCWIAISLKDSRETAVHRQFFEACLEATNKTSEMHCDDNVELIKTCNRASKTMAREK